MRISFTAVGCVPYETMVQNVAYSKALGLPYVGRSERPPLAVVGGGPSIIDHAKELRGWEGDVWACGSPFQWCRRNGIDATFFCIDPSPGTAELARGAKRGIVATSVEAAVFNEIDRVEVFDLVTTADYMNHNTTTASAAPTLAVSMGYGDITFYGCESSFSESSHAYKDEIDPYLIRVECGGEYFLTNPAFLMQAEFMAQVLRLSPVFKEKSGGLLRALMECPEYDITHGTEALKNSMRGNNGYLSAA